MKFFTSIKTMAVMMVMLLMCNVAMAGNGTKDNPYTPAEFNAQKEAEPTGVKAMEDVRSKMADVWYDLLGRKFTKKPTTKGIYVTGECKVVVE